MTDDTSTHPVRKPADWMVRADDRILELLATGTERYLYPPKMIYSNTTVGQNWVYKRLRKLVDAGLVSNQDGLYQLTDLGKAYLDGSISPEDIPHPDDDHN